MSESLNGSERRIVLIEHQFLAAAQNREEKMISGQPSAADVVVHDQLIVGPITHQVRRPPEFRRATRRINPSRGAC